MLSIEAAANGVVPEITTQTVPAERISILALDLGTTTGWALSTGTVKLSGIWSLKPGRFDGGGMRFVRFKANLDKLHAASPIDKVYFEEVRRHAGTDAAHVYGGLMGILTAWCEEKMIPYEGVPVGTIKKHATGKGNADKVQMIKAMVDRGYSPVTSDEADALALLDLMLDQ
jgi:Holliday junction resolvasome RuvABC endonuclease subunit